MKSVFEEYPGDWVMITTSSTRYIGRIICSDGKERILQPVFECFPQMEMNQGGIGRDLLVLPFDMCVSMNTKIRISNHNTIVYFDDFDNEDRRIYEEKTELAANMAMAGRAQRAGISLTIFFCRPKASTSIFLRPGIPFKSFSQKYSKPLLPI